MLKHEDIIRMARETDLVPSWMQNIPEHQLKWIEDFAALVAAAEREACAEVCDLEVARLHAIDEPRPALAVGICAAVIRERGEKT